MSTTLNKLEYLDETKIQIKTALNQFGSGITDEDTFRSYVSKINEIYTNWQKVTGIGTTITLQNTKLAKMILKFGGNTEQDSTTGKNKLSYTLAVLKTTNTAGTWNNNVYSINGLTFEVNEDLTIKVNGTATGENYTRFALFGTPFSFSADTNYFMSGCPNGGSASTYMIKLNVTGDNDVGSGKLIYRENAFNSGVYIQVETGTQCSNLLFKPQIELGTSATSYEMPIGITPNPDYTQNIKVVKGNNEIIISTRNFWSFGIAKLGHCSLIDGKWVEPQNAYTFFFPTNILPDNITFNITGGNRSNVSYWNNLPNINDIAESYSRTNYSTLPRSVTVNKNYKYLAIQVTYGVSLSALSNGQLEEGNSLSTYSVSEHQTYPITLPEGMELCKIGDYQDKIFHNIPNSPYYDSSLINGSWYKISECKKDIITSFNSLYTSVGSGYIGAQKEILDLKSNSRTNGYCNQLISINSTYNASQECICFGANNKYLYIVLKDTRINNPSIDDFNSYLENNPLEICYPLETPTTTPITDTTLINQLNDLYNKAKSYYGQTNIITTCESGNVPFIINANALMKGGN